MPDTKFTDAIVLIQKDGRRWEFKDIYEAVDALADWRILDRLDRSHSCIGDHYTPITRYNYNTHRDEVIGHVEYIMRTEFGDVITSDDIEKARDDNYRRRRSYYNEKKIARSNRDFRCAPEPNISYSRRYYLLRRIHTYPEYRDNEALLCDEDAIEHRIKPRAKRVAMNLPNSWDDIYRSDYRNKNWKRNRKTQWKEKK